MPSIMRSAHSLSLSAARLTMLFAFGLLLTIPVQTARAQTAVLEVNVEGEQAQFVARGQLSSVSVEVYAPSGELVFQSAPASAGQAVTWDMRNEAGERVADGVYIATVSMHLDSGKLRKRIEQVTVNHESGKSASGQAGVAQSADAPTTAGVGPINGQGTSGKLAKFSAMTEIGDSVVTEFANRIGVNTTTPTAALHVQGLQPASQAANNRDYRGAALANLGRQRRRDHSRWQDGGQGREHHASGGARRQRRGGLDQR